jgi:hypothetical protein
VIPVATLSARPATATTDSAVIPVATLSARPATATTDSAVGSRRGG